jgi:hypothetical protein
MTRHLHLHQTIRHPPLHPMTAIPRPHPILPRATITKVQVRVEVDTEAADTRLVFQQRLNQ